MVANLPYPSNVIVLGIINSAQDIGPPYESNGTPVLEYILKANDYLSNAYAPNYLDVYKLLRQHGDGSSNDAYDISVGYTPRSLRADPLHLDLSGYTLVASNVALLLSNRVYFEPASDSPPKVVGSNYSVTLPLHPPAEFFRLHKP